MSAQPSPDSDFVDPRRDVDRLLGNYAEDHRDPTNQRIHTVCVPLIVWTVVAALWVIPVPAAFGKPGLWAALAAVGAMGYYIRLSHRLAMGVFVGLVAYFLATYYLHDWLGSTRLLIAAAAVFVLAWVGQFIGHHIEGRRPSFLTDLQYLLIGPLWLLAKLLRRLGVAY